MIIVDYSTKKVLQGKLWQYNYGQVLRFQGGNLNKVQEIQFAFFETGADSLTRFGVTKDGVTDVVIPDTMLENNDSEVDYPVYVFIYNRDETSGETVDKFVLNVLARSKPEHTGGSDDEEIFHKAIEAVRESAERAETAEQKSAQHAEQTKADAIKTGEDRTAIAELVESVSGIGEQVETVKEYKDQAQTAASNAVLSEQASEQAKESALQAQANAETAAGKAEQHALEVAGDKTEVERLATQVRQDKTVVEQTAQEFASTASQAVQSVNTAKTQGVNAINTAKTNAVKEVQTEGTTQTGNVTAEGTKQVQAVQTKGQEIINSIPEDFTTQMATKLNKQQGTENAGKALVIGDDGNVVPGEVQGGGVQPLKLLNTIDITQQVNSVKIDLTGDYDKYYVIGNCVIPEESTGTVVLYQFVKLADKTGSNLKFYDTYGNKGKTLNMSLTMERKKKEDGTYMIRMHGMYTTSDYTAGKIYRDNIDTGWVDKDIAGKKILKYTSISISAMINSGNLEIYGGA